MRYKKFLVLPLVILVLTACSKTESYQYLMTHPEKLKVILQTCQHEAINTVTCKLAERADKDLTLLTAQATANPRGFGAKILKAQQNLAASREALQAAKLNYAKASTKKLTQALLDAQKQEQAAQMKVARLLTVVKLIGE